MANTSESEVATLLREIRDLLIPISAYYRPQFEELKRQEAKVKVQEFESLLTPVREIIFPLLFNPPPLSQIEIAEIAQTSQPTVSRFVAQLLEKSFIEQIVDQSGNTVFIDRFNLVDYMKNRKGEKS